MKRMILTILAFISILSITACAGVVAQTTLNVPTAQVATTSTRVTQTIVNTAPNPTATLVPTPAVEYDGDDLATGASPTAMIVLAGDAISVEGGGAAVNGQVVTITAAGMYHLSGALNDGQVVIDT